MLAFPAISTLLAHTLARRLTNISKTSDNDDNDDYDEDDNDDDNNDNGTEVAGSGICLRLNGLLPIAPID